MHTLRTYLLLAVAMLLLTGFSWNFGVEPCKDALDKAETLGTLRDDSIVRQTEARILSQCPDGAAAHFVTALQLERIGNIDGSIAEYRRSLQQDPTFARASGNVGLLYLRKGMLDEASVELARGLSRHQDPAYHRAMAQIFAERKVYPLAIYHYNEVRREQPGDTSIPTSLAEIYSAIGQQDKALEEYRLALVADPSNGKAHLGSAAIRLQRNQPDVALVHLQQAETSQPQNRTIHLMLAGIYEKKGDAKNAEYHNLMAGRGKTASSASSHVVASAGADVVDKDIESLKATVKRHPDDVEAFEKLGHLYRSAGKDAEALEAYRQAAHLNSGSSDVYLNLGILYEKRSQLDEAVVAYKRAIKVNPAHAEAHLRLGDIRFARGLFQETVEHYSEFLKLRPNSPDIHLKLARVFARSKESSLAITAYTSVLSYSPDVVDANREIAALYALKGDNAKAIEHYRKVLAQRKDDSEARTGLVSVYVKGKQYGEITELLKEAVDLNPEDSINHYKLGLIYDFNKDFDNAATSYKRAVELKPDNARALNALGRLYMKTGRLTEAKEALEAAKKADPTMEEAKVLLNNIRDEFNPEPHKITKGKKGSGKKSKKASKGKSTKKSKGGKAAKPVKSSATPPSGKGAVKKP